MRNRYDFQLSQDDDNRSDNASDYSRNRRSIHSVSYISSIIFVLFLFGLLASAFFIDDTLPTPLSISDEVSSIITKIFFLNNFILFLFFPEN